MARLDYLSAAYPDTLDELTETEDRALLSLAILFGKVSLIDNTMIES